MATLEDIQKTIDELYESTYQAFESSTPNNLKLTLEHSGNEWIQLRKKLIAKYGLDSVIVQYCDDKFLAYQKRMEDFWKDV